MQTQRLYPGFPNSSSPSPVSGRYSPNQYSRTRHCMTNPPLQANLFGGVGIDESFLHRASAEAALMDMKAVRAGDMFSGYGHQAQLPTTTAAPPHGHHHLHTELHGLPELHPHHQMGGVHPGDPIHHHSMHPSHPFQQYSHPGFSPMGPTHAALAPVSLQSQLSPMSALPPGPSRYPVVMGAPSEADTDPRELERFAEHFKQRRIKLGVTQADVGKALAHLKMPGVGSLSQSTICRFESLTLSHNNMVALKPILHSWLEKAEEATKTKDPGGILPSSEKKRKRTSIAAPEKRSLEAYFSIQPRPSGEKIAAIAEKLDLKKNVVRVWFCNQRQKQKRWRYSASACPQDGGLIKQEIN